MYLTDMPPFLMLQALFAAVCILFAGGFLVSQTFNKYNGSQTAKLAVETANKCETKKDNSTAYALCMKDLQGQMGILSETGELKLDDCYEAGEKAYCWVRANLVPRRLELTKAALAELKEKQRKAKGTSTTTTTTTPRPKKLFNLGQ